MCTQSCVLLCSCPPGPTVDRLMAMEPRADLLLRWNPGQTDWGHNGTCGNPINTREPSGDRLMHGNPSKTGEKTGTQGRPRGNPGQTFHPGLALRRPQIAPSHFRGFRLYTVKMVEGTRSLLKDAILSDPTWVLQDPMKQGGSPKLRSGTSVPTPFLCGGESLKNIFGFSKARIPRFSASSTKF